MSPSDDYTAPVTRRYRRITPKSVPSQAHERERLNPWSGDMHLMWFRADLRTLDNPALDAACASDQPVIAVFMVTRQQWALHDRAPVQQAYERRVLGHLQDDLARLGIPLVVLEDVDTFANCPDALARLCQQLGVTQLYWNAQYEWNERRRDRAAKQRLSQQGVTIHTYHDQCIVPPKQLNTTPKSSRNGDPSTARPYTVFTPFYRRWQQWIDAHPLVCVPEPTPRSSQRHAQALTVLARNHLTPVYSGETPMPLRDPVSSAESERITRMLEVWPAAQAQVHTQLTAFCEQPITQYDDLRDRADQSEPIAVLPTLNANATSQLSAALAVGCLSTRQCWQAAQNTLRARDSDTNTTTSIHRWISELAWRDFYRHVMVGFSRVSRGRAFQMPTEQLGWRNDPHEFAAWQNGLTGFPIVDAAMRSLQAQGWMHNRLRMVVSMFLAKDLLIDWRWGERFFMQHLIDGDLASNNGGWQWSASTGTDAAPYFRLFNPTAQSLKCDPQGHFIRHWVPELHELDAKAIHEPYAYGYVGDYPRPIIDHKLARERCLAAFAALKTAT